MSAQLTSRAQDRIRALQQSLIGLFIVLDNVQRVQIFRIEAVPSQDLLSKVALKRRKAQPSFLIVPQQKLDQGVAQPANTVIEKNGIRIGHQGYFVNPLNSVYGVF